MKNIEKVRNEKKNKIEVKAGYKVNKIKVLLVKAKNKQELLAELSDNLILKKLT